MSMDILPAKMCSLLLLTQKLNPPHNKNNDLKPVRKDLPGFWGINTATINAAMAILHQGRKRQKPKLNRAVRIREIKNFMLLI